MRLEGIFRFEILEVVILNGDLGLGLDYINGWIKWNRVKIIRVEKEFFYFLRSCDFMIIIKGRNEYFELK